MRQTIGRVLLAAGLGTAALAAPAAAQDGQATPDLTQAADRSFDIPAQPIGSALAAFSRQSGMRVSVEGSPAGNATSTGINGSMNPDQALARLLAGTGLSFRRTGPDAIVVSAPAATTGVRTGAVQLDPIQVTGAKDGAYGPDVGYVVRRSATATKTDTPLIETPQSISVVTRDQIDDQAATNVGEALRYTAGVVPEFRGVSSGSFDQIIVRGYTADRYWDGLKIPGIGTYGAPNPDLFLLQRVEVLKGPSSVLFGQGTPGGIVNLVSRRPVATPVHELRLDIGSFGRTFGAFDIGGKADEEGQWLYRVTGLGMTGGTQVDDTQEARIAIAPAFTWQPSADTSLTVLASYQYEPAVGYYDVLPAIGLAVPNPRGAIPQGFFAGEPAFNSFTRSYLAAGYLFGHRFNDFFEVRQNLRYVTGNFSWDAVQFSSLAANNFTVNRYALRNQASGSGLTVDTQGELAFSTGPLAHKVLLGIDYLWSNTENRMWTGAAPTINLFTPVYGGQAVLPFYPSTNVNQISSQLGFYAQDQVRLGNLIGVFGVRRDLANSQSYNRNNNVSTPQQDDATTWRAGLLYLFDIGVAPYVNFSQSFQPTPGTSFYQMPFQPRRGTQYEAGIKYQPTSFSGLFTAAVFQMNEQNRLTPDLLHTCAVMNNAPGCGNFSVQVGEVRTQGIELEAKASPLPGLNLIASYTYLDARITQSNSGDVGQRLPLVPTSMASGWFDYTFTQGALEGFGFGGGVRFMGPSPANTLTNANYFEAPAYTLFDAALHYDFEARFPTLKGAGLRINAQNIANTQYAASCGGNSLQAGYCFGGLARTITASLTYRW